MNSKLKLIGFRNTMKAKTGTDISENIEFLRKLVGYRKTKYFFFVVLCSDPKIKHIHHRYFGKLGFCKGYSLRRKSVLYRQRLCQQKTTLKYSLSIFVHQTIFKNEKNKLSRV
jgi:hypothetical protein